MKIVAKGTIDGKKQVVTFEEGVEVTNLLLIALLETPEPLGGTYYPEPYEPINVYYTLKDRYFDELESIEVEGELGEIPQPNGVDGIY